MSEPVADLACEACSIASDVRAVAESPLNLYGGANGVTSLATAVEVLARAVMELAARLQALEASHSP